MSKLCVGTLSRLGEETVCAGDGSDACRSMRGTVSSVEYTVASGVSKSADCVMPPSMSFFIRGCLISNRPRLLPIVVEDDDVELPRCDE